MTDKESLPKVCPLLTDDGYCGYTAYREKECDHKKDYLKCSDFSMWFWSRRAKSAFSIE